MGLQLVLRQRGQGKAVIEQYNIPVPAPGEILIKVKAVALNPLDWKLLQYRDPPSPTVLGCDCSGFVESVDQNVTRFEVGDRVAGMVSGGEVACSRASTGAESLIKDAGNILRPDDGAFAEYVVSPAHLLLHLPDHISFEEGSTLGVPLLTAGFCLYKNLSLAYPGKTAPDSREPQSVLIYGGGTSIGLMQIQLAAL